VPPISAVEICVDEGSKGKEGLMKYFILAALALASAPAALSQATQEPGTIDVVGQKGHQAWVGMVSGKLDASLARETIPQAYPNWSLAEGAVAVQFTVGANGSADAVTLYEGSRHNELDRTALRAVAGLTDIAALPDDIAIGQKVRANILFAADPASLQRLVARVRTQEATRQAREGQTGERVVVLTARTLRRG
jgi:TonB family protein